MVRHGEWEDIVLELSDSFGAQEIGLVEGVYAEAAALAGLSVAHSSLTGSQRDQAYLTPQFRALARENDTLA